MTFSFQFKVCNGQFACTNGTCIDLGKVCDGINHCQGNEDENQLKCFKIKLKNAKQTFTFSESNSTGTEQTTSCKFAYWNLSLTYVTSQCVKVFYAHHMNFYLKKQLFHLIRKNFGAKMAIIYLKNGCVTLKGTVLMVQMKISTCAVGYSKFSHHLRICRLLKFRISLFQSI